MYKNSLPTHYDLNHLLFGMKLNWYCISLYSFLLWIVSSPQWGNYSSFYYVREKLMRKLFQIFKVLQFRNRIVAAATIWGNTVSGTWKCWLIKNRNQLNKRLGSNVLFMSLIGADKKCIKYRNILIEHMFFRNLLELEGDWEFLKYLLSHSLL